MAVRPPNVVNEAVRKIVNSIDDPLVGFAVLFRGDDILWTRAEDANGRWFSPGYDILMYGFARGGGECHLLCSDYDSPQIKGMLDFISTGGTAQPIPLLPPNVVNIPAVKPLEITRQQITEHRSWIRDSFQMFDAVCLNPNLRYFHTGHDVKVQRLYALMEDSEKNPEENPAEKVEEKPEKEPETESESLAIYAGKLPKIINDLEKERGSVMQRIDALYEEYDNGVDFISESEDAEEFIGPGVEDIEGVDKMKLLKEQVNTLDQRIRLLRSDLERIPGQLEILKRALDENRFTRHARTITQINSRPSKKQRL